MQQQRILSTASLVASTNEHDNLFNTHTRANVTDNTNRGLQTHTRPISGAEFSWAVPDSPLRTWSDTPRWKRTSQVGEGPFLDMQRRCEGRECFLGNESTTWKEHLVSYVSARIPKALCGVSYQGFADGVCKKHSLPSYIDLFMTWNFAERCAACIG